jgi:Domain of unknown function (DUF3459)
MAGSWNSCCIRQGSAALKTGSVEVLEASGDLLVLRRAAGDAIACTVNFGDKPLARPADGLVLLTSSSGAAVEPRGFVWVRSRR